MRLTPKKIEQILVRILGEEGLPLIKELMVKENISEFDLATKIKKDIKIVRKMLYILYNHNVVGFTRKKDKQKGWYIYYWTLMPENVRFSYFKMIRDNLQQLQEQLELEKRELFFICPNRCTRLTFDQAMEFEFHCPECGQLTNQENAEEKIAEIYEQIAETQEELAKFQEKRRIKRKVIREQKKAIKTQKKQTVKKKMAKKKR